MDAEHLVGEPVDAFAPPQPAVPLEVLACIESVEERFAMDELILNQQKSLHSELACRVARLEARQKEIALERQARLAALERESDLESRLHMVETITSSPLRTLPRNVAASLRRTSSAPKSGSAHKLARSLSLAAMAEVPEEAGSSSGEGSDGAGLISWPLVTNALFDAENEPPVPDASPSPAPRRRQRSLRCVTAAQSSGSSETSASMDSACSASMTSPAFGAVMRQIPSFMDSLPPTPCSGSVRRTPRGSSGSAGVFGSPTGMWATPASVVPLRLSPPCSCRSVDSADDGSPTIHSETCSGQAVAEGTCSSGKSRLRRAKSTPASALSAA